MDKSATSPPLLELRDLSKHFRSYWTFSPIQAVSNVSLRIEQGESFGFLGHNGAGKTTTIKSIVGLIRATSGEILFSGKALSSNEQREQIGYLPEQPYFYDHLSVQETLSFFASLYGIPYREQGRAISEALSLVNLRDRERSSVRSLSKGLQQRVALAQAILNKPKLLLLDEPFSGLDPIGRKEVRDLILALRAEGSTIFLSSHILSDVEDICDRVAIMVKGSIRKEFSLDEAASLFGTSFELVIASATPEQLQIADTVEQSSTETTQGTYSTLRFDTYADAESAIDEAKRHSIRIVSFRTVGRSLEDIFVSATEEAEARTE